MQDVLITRKITVAQNKEFWSQNIFHIYTNFPGVIIYNRELPWRD